MISPRPSSWAPPGRRDLGSTAKWTLYGAAVYFAILLLISPGIASAHGRRAVRFRHADHGDHHHFPGPGAKLGLKIGGWELAHLWELGI